MIHLDRNHTAAISPHSKPNLIPADRQILSWSPPTTRDDSFFHDLQDEAKADKPRRHITINGALADRAPTAVLHDLPKLPAPTPSSPAEPPSPGAATTSSLSPPPDTTSPVTRAEAQLAPDPRPDGGKAREEEQGDKADELENASRVSTPLSELSSALDLDEVQESEGRDESHSNDASEARGEHQNPGESSSSTAVSANLKDERLKSSSALRDAAAAAAATSQAQAHALEGLGQRSTVEGSSSGFVSQHHMAALKSSEPSSREQSLLRQLPMHVPSSSSSSTPNLDPKVVAVLELNAHLLEALLDFQSRGVLTNDPRFIQFGTRLQSNLTWLAGSADESRKVSSAQIPLPMMQPPPVVDLIDMDRIQQLYKELPTIFMKEIMRRQQAALSVGSSLPHANVQNLNGKRDRPDETAINISNKRRDIGESKLPTPIAPAPPISHPSGPSFPNVPSQSISPTNSLSQYQSEGINAQAGPSMPPPPLPVMSAGNDNQLERARQYQMQQAMHQRQLSEGSRRMSPTAGPQQSVASMQHPTGSSNSNTSQMSPQHMALLAQLGPQAVQNYQLLQTPNHAFVQYMHQNIPGFAGLPLQQQLLKMQQVQVTLQARQRAQSQSGGSMGGYPPGSTPSISSSGLPSGSMSMSSNSPTRISASHQSPSMPIQSQSPQNTYPYSNQNVNGIDPRTLSNGMAPQQGNMANFNNNITQQRQLMLMQQQMARGGVNNQMMNAQMQERMRQAQQQQQQQQRMAQAGSPTHPGPSMSGDSSTLSILRSNPSVPGIARSTRTPSDSAPSPMGSQPQRMEEYQRQMMMQQQVQQSMAQNMGLSQMGNGTWARNGQQAPQQQQQQQQQQQMAQMGPPPGSSYGMSPPNSAGPAQGYGGAPSPVGSQNWVQGQGASGQYAYGAGSPIAGQHHADVVHTPRQASATPAPHQQMSQNSPSMDQMNELFNWTQ